MSAKMSPIAPKDATSVKKKRPNPTSVFVLFEGPWLIHHPAAGKLCAITFGDLVVCGVEVPHQCSVGFGNATGQIVNPAGKSAPDLLLMPGDPCLVKESGKFRSARKALSEVFDVPLNRPKYNDVFVYLQDETSFPVRPDKKKDRIVTLPIPDNVYVAGRLLSGRMEASNKGMLRPDPKGVQLPMPHVTTICEYTADSKPNLELLIAGENPIEIPPGKHLIFRMMHKSETKQSQSMKAMKMSNAQEAAHIEAAFATLWTRVKPTDASASLALTKVQHPMFRIGHYTADFGPRELGFKKPKGGGGFDRIITPADCGGTTFVVRSTKK
jgi:hypothetical protein